jgi:amidase
MTDLARLSARDAASRIAAGTLTSEALVGACLERIAEREPAVRAFAHLDPDEAVAQARARDREAPRGPLHGIPIGVKDIMATADMPTGYGSGAYEGYRPVADAACVALARAAGAVILGKTVTTEFAARSPGKTLNPHNPAFTPGGSSSGSAAGVADFMMPLAFGTQTAGSIIRPAAFCGVVGYKPSFGLVPIAGTQNQSPSLDTIGGFARHVADVAFFIAALTERPSLVPEGLAQHPRIGLYEPAPMEQATLETRAALAHAAECLDRAGAAIVPRPRFAPFDRLLEAHQTIMGYESARNLAWERLDRAERLTPLTQETLAQGAAITAAAYDAAQREAAAARAAVAPFFGDLDAVLVPAAPGEAPRGTDSTGDPVFNRPWTLLHLPCLTLPAGRGPNGLPLGVQLVGRPREDARLLAVGVFAEAALLARP